MEYNINIHFAEYIAEISLANHPYQIVLKMRWIQYINTQIFRFRIFPHLKVNILTTLRFLLIIHWTSQSRRIHQGNEWYKIRQPAFDDLLKNVVHMVF